MKLKHTLFVAALALFVPAVVSAQVCLGLPQGTRTSAAVQLGFPSNATSFGVSGTTGVGERMYAGASYTLTSPNASGASNLNTFGVHGAYEMTDLIEGASFCPGVSANYGKLEGMSMISVPVGVSIGKTFPLGESTTTTITPFAAPQIVWSQLSYKGASASDTNFGFTGGGTVGFGRYFAGASLSKVFVTGSEAGFTIHGGLSF